MASPQEIWGDPRRRKINEEVAKLIQVRRTKRLTLAQEAKIDKQLEELYAMMPPMHKEPLLTRIWERLFG